MWALEELEVVGRLTVADPKRIASGGLNRCLYFTHADIGDEKAMVLARKTSRSGFTVDAFPHSFSELVAQRQRVRRVFTTPDSREARRSVQADLPIEVLDASTTDLTAVVVHSHRQPTPGACLSCIYPHIPMEDQRRIHMAEGLGLTLEEVRQGLIDEPIANKLAGLHPALVAEELVGKAFDSVYKEQCGKAALLNAAGQQAVAPLAFISNFAGALLALELVRFEFNPSVRESSYLSLDPWRPPHLHARRARGRLPGCEFCGANGPAALRAIWPEIYT
jgi:molybdopterin/thiamine biosynthesis adenylyltransferase